MEEIKVHLKKFPVETSCTSNCVVVDMHFRSFFKYVQNKDFELTDIPTITFYEYGDPGAFLKFLHQKCENTGRMGILLRPEFFNDLATDCLPIREFYKRAFQYGIPVPIHDPTK